MPGLTLQTEGIVLLKRDPAESYQPFTVFSTEHGVLALMQRVAKKAASTAITLDLFDEISFVAESSNQGRTWFIKEVRLLNRPSGIGRSYDSLRHACAFAAVVARNPPDDSLREPVATLLRQALSSFAVSSRPDFVYFKSLYCLARDEGHPLRQHWLTTLPADFRSAADTILRTPLAALEESPHRADIPATLCELLITRLEEYLKGHTELLMD